MLNRILSYLQSFNSKSIEKHKFRDQLRQSLGLKLSTIELDSLMPKLDVLQSGSIDGTEFINLFLKLRNEFRNKMLSDKLNIEQKKRKNMISIAKKK